MNRTIQELTWEHDAAELPLLGRQIISRPETSTGAMTLL